MKIDNIDITKLILKELGLKNEFNIEDINNIFEILTIGNSVLREKNENVDITQKEVVKLVINMVNSLYYWNGCGIAAPQIGKNLNIFIVKIYSYDEDDKEKIIFPLTVFVNPKIIEYSEDKSWDYEGCLSVPEFDAKVERSNTIKIEYEDINGKKHCETYSDYTARAIQHEYDHLRGIIYTDIADMKTFTTRDNLIENNKID